MPRRPSSRPFMQGVTLDTPQEAAVQRTPSGASVPRLDRYGASANNAHISFVKMRFRVPNLVRESHGDTAGIKARHPPRDHL